MTFHSLYLIHESSLLDPHKTGSSVCHISLVCLALYTRNTRHGFPGMAKASKLCRRGRTRSLHSDSRHRTGVVLGLSGCLGSVLPPRVQVRWHTSNGGDWRRHGRSVVFSVQCSSWSVRCGIRNYNGWLLLSLLFLFFFLRLILLASLLILLSFFPRLIIITYCRFLFPVFFLFFSFLFFFSSFFFLPIFPFLPFGDHCSPSHLLCLLWPPASIPVSG